MNGDPYNAAVRELFANPQHAGTLPGAPCGFVDEQGIMVRFSATVSDDRLLALRFLVRGCPHVVAACELICRQQSGQPLAALESVNCAQIMTTLAIPAEKTGRILVVEDAIRSLLQALRQ